jgi:hypothetical protein
MPFIVSVPLIPPRLPTNSQYWSRTVAPKSAPQVPSLIQSGQSLSIFSHEVSRRIMVRSKYFMVFIVFRSLDQVSILCQLSFMVDIINTRMNTKTLQTVSIFKQKCKFSYSGWPRPTILPRPSPDPIQHGDRLSGVRFDTLT